MWKYDRCDGSGIYVWDYGDYQKQTHLEYQALEFPISTDD
jgi:hypothetical protein